MSRPADNQFVRTTPLPLGRPREELDPREHGFSYVCRRCEVWGRVPAGAGRRCWSCDRADSLERR